MSSTQKRAILQVRIRDEDKQHAEHLYDAMGTSLAEAVRLFVAQSILTTTWWREWRTAWIWL